MNPVFKVLMMSLSLISFSQVVDAQELANYQLKILKDGDVESFQKEFGKDSYNKCFEVKESSYNLLAISIKMDNLQLFDFLLKNGADVDKICDNKTPLMFAAKYGKEDFANKLLAKGADKKLTNNKGYTAKDYAEKGNFTTIIELLK